jgi:DNA-binding MarR family transcriptional regulator
MEETMDKEILRQSLNAFLKRYYDGSKELYQRMDLPELTQKQFKYLQALDTDPPLTMTDLADQFLLAKPTVTDMVNKFKKAGLIKRTRSKTDQRIYYLNLTPLGQTMANTNTLESEELTKTIQSILTEEEQHLLKKLFDKIGHRS